MQPVDGQASLRFIKCIQRKRRVLARVLDRVRANDLRDARSSGPGVPSVAAMGASSYWARVCFAGGPASPPKPKAPTGWSHKQVAKWLRDNKLNAALPAASTWDGKVGL